MAIALAPTSVDNQKQVGYRLKAGQFEPKSRHG